MPSWGSFELMSGDLRVAIMSVLVADADEIKSEPRGRHAALRRRARNGLESTSPKGR
jgi:hypothetical protein